MAENSPELSQNRGFLFGDGVFETFRTEGEGLYFPSPHILRMLGGMRALEFDFILNTYYKFLQKALADEMKGKSGPGRLRITVFRSGGGAFTPESNVPETVFHYRKLDSGFTESEISIAPNTKIPLFFSPWSGYKTLNALPYVMAAKWARNNGWDDTLLLSGDHIAETSRANIAMLRDGVIHLPPKETGRLPGTMASQFNQWWREMGYEFREQPFTLAELLNAEEIVTMNSIQGIAAVKEIEGVPFPGKTGGFYQKSLKTLLTESPNHLKTY